MKKLLCFLLCLTLIFSSVSLAFAATQDVSDAQTHTILGNIYNLLNGNILTRLNNINNKLTDINANLLDLMSWLDPSNNTSTNSILNQILNALVYTDAGGALKSWLVDIYQDGTNLPLIYAQVRSHNLKYADEFAWLSNNKSYKTVSFDNYGLSTPTSNTGSNYYNAQNQNLLTLIDQNSQFHNDLFYYTKGYPFNITNLDTLQTDTFTPYSLGNAIIRYLQKIQTPAARLAYVLASDERIDAQEKAADNEQAVVDNFIDSTGDGSASTSDIGSVSDLSAGYKQNFGTNASPSGIFDIFNSDHATWFSQETKNQLDTTTSTRLTKGSQSETPLLDKQIEEIYNALGVKQP